MIKKFPYQKLSKIWQMGLRYHHPARRVFSVPALTWTHDTSMSTAEGWHRGSQNRKVFFGGGWCGAPVFDMDLSCVHVSQETKSSFMDLFDMYAPLTEMLNYRCRRCRGRSPLAAHAIP